MTTIGDVLRLIDPETVTTLCRRLVQTNSENPPGREEAVAQVIADQARHWGLRATLDRLSSGRANVIVEGGPADESTTAPGLVYCGHLDTVPCGGPGWRYGPLAAELADGRVWGRGSVDMKGSLAAMLSAIAALRRADAALASRVTLIGLVGEEVDCAGSRQLAASGHLRSARWLVVGEPTNLELVVAHKGALRLEVAVQGRSAHGAYPEFGINAVTHMARVVNEIGSLRLPAKTHPILGSPTLSINTIQGGTAINVVPDRCTAVLDIRTVPGQDHAAIVALVERSLAQVLPAGASFDVQIISEAMPVTTDPGHPLVAAARQAAQTVLGKDAGVGGAAYFSDASVLQPATGLPALLFGPGEVERMHQVDESIAVEDLFAAAQVFAALPVILSGEYG